MGDRYRLAEKSKWLELCDQWPLSFNLWRDRDKPILEILENGAYLIVMGLLDEYDRNPDKEKLEGLDSFARVSMLRETDPNECNRVLLAEISKESKERISSLDITASEMTDTSQFKTGGVFETVVQATIVNLARNALWNAEENLKLNEGPTSRK